MRAGLGGSGGKLQCLIGSKRYEDPVWFTLSKGVVSVNFVWDQRTYFHACNCSYL